MRPSERVRANRLGNELRNFDAQVQELPGIRLPGHFTCLVEQLVESRRRIEFIHHIRDEQHDPRRLDPATSIFDPLRASVLLYRRGDVDEAYWLVFLAVHFGKHVRDGWRLVRDVYGRLGGPGLWDWGATSADPPAFRAWLAANADTLRGNDGVLRRFSNHRKYESLNPYSMAGTGAVVASYIAWVRPPRTHQEMVRQAHQVVGQNPREVFHYLYCSMNAVQRFGRLAKFDYLAMLDKLGISPIEPGSAYLAEATGPLKGARLLFVGDVNAKLGGRVLDGRLAMLDEYLQVGMQTLEDALCNWQKSPASFISFKG